MIKKTSLTILFSLCILLCACSKGGNKLNKVVGTNITFDSIVVDTAAYLTSDPNSPKCDLKIRLVYARGKNSGPINKAIIHSGILSPDYLALTDGKITVRRAIDSFVSNYIADYKKTYGEINRQEPNALALNIEYVVETKTLKGRNNTVVYLAETYAYNGGAHGWSSSVAKNINLTTGKILTLKDVFVPGSEQIITDLIVEKLMKDTDTKSLKDLQNMGYFMDITPYASENFMLEEDKITFIYCADEIGPHSLGETRVEIKYSDVEKYLKKGI